MKLPIPLLLYVVSLGLFGLTGWTVYQMLPIWKAEVRDAATRKGQDQGKDLLAKGRSQGPQQTNWMYTKDTALWWAGLKDAHLIGKLPAPPADPDKPKEPEKPVVVDQRPLEQLVELVSLVFDGQSAGKGGNTHVVVRFKPEANAQPPDWWVKENMSAPAGAAPPLAPQRDTVGRGKQAPGPAAPPKAGGPVRPANPLPTASASGHEMLQKLWAQDEGDPRRSAVLWPMKSNDGREIGKIRLVRVADDAQSAFFVRELPPPKAGDPAPEPKEEELLKTSADLSQDILRELRLMQGRAGSESRHSAPAVEQTSSWTDVPETTRTGNNVIISKKDELRFREHSDDLLEQLTVDAYAGRSGARGLIVKAVDPRLAGFGVTPGEVLLEINGKKVESKAQAVSAAKGDYNRGVRTFTTKWLSNGQVIERIFQSPPGK